jgi:hypothetical protein
VATGREITYVEEKGMQCESGAHRRNHTVAAVRTVSPVAMPISAKAS